MRPRFLACLGILLVGVGAGLAFATTPAILPIEPPPEAPVSRIPIVFKTSWPALVALADSAIPKCAGKHPVCEGTEASGNYIMQHEDDWFVFATILGRDIGWKGSTGAGIR